MVRFTLILCSSQNLAAASQLKRAGIAPWNIFNAQLNSIFKERGLDTYIQVVFIIDVLQQCANILWNIFVLTISFPFCRLYQHMIQSIYCVCMWTHSSPYSSHRQKVNGMLVSCRSVRQTTMCRKYWFSAVGLASQNKQRGLVHTYSYTSVHI